MSFVLTTVLCFQFLQLTEANRTTSFAHGDRVRCPGSVAERRLRLRPPRPRGDIRTNTTQVVAIIHLANDCLRVQDTFAV